MLENKDFSFRIPNGVFSHTNPNENLSYKATSPAGGALPSWIKFNPDTKTFSGTPPAGAKAESVVVIVKDSNGKEVRASFVIGVNKEDNTVNSRIRPTDSTPRPTTKPPVNTKPQPQVRMKNNFDVLPGKPGFTEQVHAVGKLSRLQESRALLDSLKQL